MDYLKTEQTAGEITYKAVESREETLRQLRDGLLDVIDLEPDPCPVAMDYDVDHVHRITPPTSPHHEWSPQSRFFSQQAASVGKRVRFAEAGDDNDNVQPAKKRRITNDTDSTIDLPQLEQLEGQQSDMTSSTPPTTQAPPRIPKRSLWHSDDAEENMMRSSGLPSPESLLSDASVELASEEQPNQNGLRSYLQPTWSFEDNDEPETTPGPLSFQFEPVTETEPDHGRPQSSSAGQSCGGIPEPLRKKRDDFEKQGIEESRRLREENQRRKERVSFAGSTSPADHHYRRPNPNSNHRRGDDNTLAQVDNTSISSLNDREEDPALIEDLLDISEDYVRGSQTISSAEAHRPKRTSQTPACRLTRSNPFSREAAEQWRTQSRHLNHSKKSDASHSLPQTNTHGSRSSTTQDKEERVARVLQNSNWSHRVRLDREAEKRMLSEKFYGVDLQSDSKKVKTTVKPRHRPRSAREIQNDLQKLMGTSDIAAANQNFKNESPAATTEPEYTPIGAPRPSLSKLKQVSSMASKLESFSKTPKAIPQEVFDNLPKQTDVESEDTPRNQRPAMFNQFSKEEQELFMERDTKREREKDLEIIRSVFTMGAQLGSLLPLDPNDPRTARQLSDIRGFAEAVLDHEKSGKTLRAKIRSIRDFFKRRLDTTGQLPDDEAASNYLSILLKPDLYEKLVSETSQVAGRLPFLTTECNRINSHYHARHPRVTAPFSNKDSIGKGTGSAIITSNKTLSAKQKLAQLRSTLNLHGKGSNESDDETEVIDLGPSRTDRDEGEISEEDEGESFTRPIGLQTQRIATAEADDMLSTVNGIHRQQDQEEPSNSQLALNVQSSQGASEGLLNQMLTRRKQQVHLGTQGVQRSDLQMVHGSRQRKSEQPIPGEQKTKELPTISDDTQGNIEYDMEEDPSQEFDDTDLDNDDEEDNDDDDEGDGPQCKRYIAKGACQGLSAHYDASDYILGHYLSKKAARKQALSFAVWIREQLSKSGQEVDVDDFKESTSENKTSFEQRVIFGDDEKVSCRAWIEEELYRPSEEAYEKAKVRKACEGYEIWFVDWERTIKPCEKQNENEDEDEEAEEEEDHTCESTSGGDRTASTENATTSEEGVKHSYNSNAVQSGTQINDFDKNSEEVSPGSSASNSHANSRRESFTSISQTLFSETNDSAKNLVISNDDTNFTPGSPTAEDRNEDEDDLFGSDTANPIFIPIGTTTPASIESSSAKTPSPPRASAPETPRRLSDLETTVTRATGDHLRMFTTIGHANRHAKEVFMRWYIDHLPGLANQGFIEHEDEAMEEELRATGNQSCWSREEDFMQERAGDVPGETVTVEDKLRVWVRKGKCFGPSN